MQTFHLESGEVIFICSANKAYLPFYLMQEKNPCIRTGFAPFEVCFNFFSTNLFKKNQLFDIIILFRSYSLLILTLRCYKTIRYKEK